MVPHRDRALVPQHPPDPSGSGPVAEAEERLRAALAELTALDLEVEALSLTLGDFGRRYEQVLGPSFADLDAAERLVRRIQALEDEVARLVDLIQRGALPSNRRRKRPSARKVAARQAARASTIGDDAINDPMDEAEDAEADPAARDADTATTAGEPEAQLEPEVVVLKRLYRRLARVLHPDLAQDEREKQRLGELMVKVNAAYAKRDRVALELMADRLGAGEPLDALSEADRMAHLEKRIGALVRIAESLRRERDRLQRSHTHRLHQEAELRRAEGRDYFEETRRELEEEERQALADARSRLVRLARAARELAKLRSKSMSNLTKRGAGPTGTLRAFDPLSESAIIRRGVVHLERQRATGPARDLARQLEEAAAATPWEAVLTLLAFFAEAAGRPPDSLSTGEGWAERYQCLVAEWPEAPDFERLLTHLPRHLEVGLRTGAREVLAGVQLRSSELLAGVRIALERNSFAELARRVLQALGPHSTCRHCGAEGWAIHLMRTRGLDELNGLVCPACAGAIRSYWRYGEVEGLEALQPFALQLGVVAEQVVRLAGAAIAFQLLPGEREGLTASALLQRVIDLYFGPYAIDVPPEQLRIATRQGPLDPSARVPPRVAVRLALDPECGRTEEEILELLRSRIERRFRPDAGGQAP
jgi:hypothetical protein